MVQMKRAAGGVLASDINGIAGSVTLTLSQIQLRIIHIMLNYISAQVAHAMTILCSPLHGHGPQAACKNTKNI